MVNYRLFFMLGGSVHDAYANKYVHENILFSSPEKAFEYLMDEKNAVRHAEYVALPYYNNI